MRHGLAVRGQTGGALHPKGLVAGILYKLFYSKNAVLLEGPQTFTKSVGGSLGPTGKMNGE
jgi:hypothetical protein